MKIEQEIETFKKRVKLLEEFRELQKRIEELEKQIAKPIIPYIPYYPQPYVPYLQWTWTGTTWTSDGNTSTLTDGQSNMTFSS